MLLMMYLSNLDKVGRQYVYKQNYYKNDSLDRKCLSLCHLFIIDLSGRIFCYNLYILIS